VKRLKLVMRHGVVSLICASTEYSLFLLLYSYFQIQLIFSFATSYLIASLIGFLGHTYFTFKVNKVNNRNIFYFVTQLCFVATIGFFILKFFLMYTDARVAKFMQLCCTFLFNILYGKFVSFKK
jgi:putative flippase GtrA